MSEQPTAVTEEHNTEPAIEIAEEVLPDPTWHIFTLRKSVVYVTDDAHGKACRVQSLDEGWWSIEVAGLEPQLTTDPPEVCLRIAELSAEQGKRVRRFIGSDGAESYRAL